MQRAPWREAAGLIMLSKWATRSPQKEFQCLRDYKILMVKRSDRTSFMSNTYVFPGGVVEPADFSSRWWSIYERFGVPKSELLDFSMSDRGIRPPIVTDSQMIKSQSNGIPPSIALRIAALRETFEETGVLLVDSRKDKTNAESLNKSMRLTDVKMWQDIVHNDPLKFIDLCLELGMFPNIWMLYEWSNWLTPTVMEKRRYDTLFYICCLSHTPEVFLDDKEVVQMEWCDPNEMLQKSKDTDVFLAPPQVYDLSRLAKIPEFNKVCNFMKLRDQEGCERWMPVVRTIKNEPVFLLPGDDAYPENVDYVDNTQPSIKYTPNEIESKPKNINRMVVKGGLRFDVHCNITPSCGHLPPVSDDSFQLSNKL